MQAVIMAGGFGTRLRPLSFNIPKPMVPMANSPMLYHIIKLLKSHGFMNNVMMLYYQPEVITGYFGDGSKFGVNIKYLKPEMDLGTAGSVRFAKDSLKEDTFLVISGDLLTDFDLGKAVEFHNKKKALATMVLTRVANPLQYGVVITEEDGKIERFLEKPSWGEVFSDTINTGIYVLDQKVFDFIPKDQPFDFSKDLFPALLKETKKLYGYIAEGYWKDVGTLEEYRLSHYDILDGKIKVALGGHAKKIGDKEIVVGEGTAIDEDVDFDGQVIIGNNCTIEKGAKINRSVIGSGVTIHAGAQIIGSVVWDGVELGRDSKLREAVIGNKTKIGDKAAVQIGTVISDECVIGPGALVRQNIKIWPHKTIEEESIVSTSLVWGEKWNRTLFSAYGITGLGNIEITPEFATKVGAAYGAYLGKGAYVVTSRDAHPASRMIKRTMISGLLSAGVRVGDLRTTPIPVIRYEMGKEGEAGGIHVRQSPFDPRLIDIKFFDSGGGDISIKQEKAIEQLFLREDFKRALLDEVGEITVSPRALEYYKSGFLKAVDKEMIRSADFKVVIDYAYSSASMIFPTILGDLGLEVVALNAHLNPRKITKSVEDFKHSLEQLSTITTTLKADIGFLIDTGAEKVFIVDEKGKVLPDDLSLVAVSELVMRTYKRGNLAVPVHVSGVVDQLAYHHKVKVLRTGTSPRQIVEGAKEKSLVLVGDCSGGFIFPEFEPAFDAMYTIGKILEMLAKAKTSISKLVNEIPPFKVHHKKLSCPWDKKGQTMRYAIEETKGKKSELIDGVKLFSNGGWVLLLPDADEAYFHVWAESGDDEKAKELLREYSEKVKKWQK
ncbi:MAG: mannose-1-phosphate guanyltransferase [Elusimicrobia bacterium]|nr:mannose-1-phosphate guanyltransferase [Candidatus Liberimonas magnetica]